jgi:polyisoprenyl-phosphate glycosyltransferase
VTRVVEVEFGVFEALFPPDVAAGPLILCPRPMPSERCPTLALIPVYDDWEVLSLLLARLDEEFSSKGQRASVVAVDDGSRSAHSLRGLRFRALQSIEILHLRRNVGHQRAIALGLAYVEARVPCETVIVMDADGEDTPEDALRLLERAHAEGGGKAVFALRHKRSEGPVFRAFYVLYRAAFRVLTGQTIRFGNFSVIPRPVLRKLVAVSEIWNHYSAGVQRARVPSVYLATSRGKRLAGRSSMNFVSLITHGMSAISVHAEAVGSRMLVAASLFAAIILSGMLAVVAIRVLTNLAIPGWASFVFGLLALLLSQTFFVALFFAGTIMHGRNSYTFVPSRDHDQLVDSLENVEVEHVS